MMDSAAVMKEALERLDNSERLVIENNIARTDMLFCSP